MPSDGALLLLAVTVSHLIVTITMERKQDRDRIPVLQIQKLSLQEGYELLTLRSYWSQEEPVQKAKTSSFSSVLFSLNDAAFT